MNSYKLRKLCDEEIDIEERYEKLEEKIDKNNILSNDLLNYFKDVSSIVPNVTIDGDYHSEIPRVMYIYLNASLNNYYNDIREEMNQFLDTFTGEELLNLINLVNIKVLYPVIRHAISCGLNIKNNNDNLNNNMRVFCYISNIEDITEYEMNDNEDSEILYIMCRWLIDAANEGSPFLLFNFLERLLSKDKVKFETVVSNICKERMLIEYTKHINSNYSILSTQINKFKDVLDELIGHVGKERTNEIVGKSNNKFLMEYLS